MLLRIKCTFKMWLLKLKILLDGKALERAKVRVNLLDAKIYKEQLDLSYIREHLHPEETWEMRAERAVKFDKL